MNTKLQWGLIGTGGIAKTFAKGVLASQKNQLVAVGSRSMEKAAAFGQDFLGDAQVRRHGSYEALLADPQVQAVYISTPHPMHGQWAVLAARAGKHILCEKPLTLNYADTMQVVEAARRHGVFLMEAFMYRCHPLIQKVVDLIREKAIGDVRMIESSFGFRAGENLEGRLFKNELGVGGILDVGCYPMSMARLVAGAAAGKDFLDPTEVKGCGVLHAKTGVDETTYAVLKFANGIVASVGTAIGSGMTNEVVILGTAGKLTLPWAWIPKEKDNKIILHENGKEPREILVDGIANVYTLEADVVADAVAAGRQEAASPAMSWNDTLGNMAALDKWRASIGMVYQAEKPEKMRMPIHGGPLRVQSGAGLPEMQYGRIAGVDKPVSRLVFGVDKVTIKTFPLAAAMMDDYFQRGGNAFDTAYIYGGGGCELALGQWVKNRRIREKVVLLGKGAHTPDCNPEALTRQLMESLDRLQTDYLDIYMMHRDNPDVPVGEFVDVLNMHLRKKRIRSFGGSNWSLARVDAFNRYAAKKGLRGFAAVSNNFSLAEMVDPVWGGCIAASDARSRAWFTKTQMPLMAWSSQARGFFTDRSSPTNKSDAELVRCWYSKANFARKKRAVKMAADKGVSPIVIALAYVLCQPFPTFPLIGPWNISETAGSFEALKIQLTPDEVQWLNLEK